MCFVPFISQLCFRFFFFFHSGKKSVEQLSRIKQVITIGQSQLELSDAACGRLPGAVLKEIQVCLVFLSSLSSASSCLRLLNVLKHCFRFQNSCRIFLFFCYFKSSWLREGQDDHR